jgi:hypothetical protein
VPTRRSFAYSRRSDGISKLVAAHRGVRGRPAHVWRKRHASPSGTIEAATIRLSHALGAVKSLQLLHCWEPFGDPWQLTYSWDILAALAGWMAVASTVATPLAQTTPSSSNERARHRVAANIVLRRFYYCG